MTRKKLRKVTEYRPLIMVEEADFTRMGRGAKKASAYLGGRVHMFSFAYSEEADVGVLIATARHPESLTAPERLMLQHQTVKILLCLLDEMGVHISVFGKDFK